MNQEDHELEKYYELCSYTLTHPDPSFIHQHVVDAFAAQRVSSHTKPIQLAFALIGLYLHAVRNYSGKQVQHVHMLLAQRRKQWPTFDLPEHRGDISVCDVVRVPPGPERDRMISKWCGSVWEAYRANHNRVVELFQAELGGLR